MKKQKICPKCRKLVDIKEYYTMGDSAIDWWRAGMVTDKIWCSQCGYSGLAIEIQRIERKGKMKKQKKRLRK